MTATPGDRYAKPALALVAGLIVADQALKWIVMQAVFAIPFLGLPFGAFPWAQPIEVTGFFNLVTVWNRGVSFGMLSNDLAAGPYLLSALAVAISGLLAWLLRRAETRFLALAYAAVIGGALGNVIDRLRFGAVFDFLDFHVAGWHWPAFNIADSAIVIGVALILLDGIFAKPRDAD